jgi:two-component system LytT family response regulator
MRAIKILVIDDERSSREELKKEIKKYDEFEIAGEAKNADEAKKLIEDLHPDLIFLDIQMPEKSGFDLLESLDKIPEVIFVTAFDQFAVQAFELNALDYLMKPIREERFAKTIEKVRDHIQKKSSTVSADDHQLFIKDGDKIHFVRIVNIFLIESLDNYSRVHFENKKACIKRSLNQWEELLDPKIFFRISRTEIININYLRKVEGSQKGRLKISLTTGQLLEVSTRQSVKLRTFMVSK